MVADFFQSEWFKRNQDGSHTIIYDVALEVTMIFYGLHESVPFWVRQPHKAKNSRSQGPLGATILKALKHNYKILMTPDPLIGYDSHSKVPQVQSYSEIVRLGFNIYSLVAHNLVHNTVMHLPPNRYLLCLDV